MKPILINDAKNLEDWVDTLVEKRVAAKKTMGTLHEYLTLIKTLMEKCESFTEFGVQQGLTTATAMFTIPKKVRGYDIELKWYDYSRQLFDTYAKQHNIDYKIIKADTAVCSVIDKVDMLHIDSLHTYEHALTELRRHGKQVQKYILLHDTTLCPGIWNAINLYMKDDTSWKILERCEVGVGHTLLERK